MGEGSDSKKGGETLKKPIVIVGAGGFGREVAQIIADINATENSWEPIGFIDDDPNKSNLCFMGIPVLGSVEKIAQYGEAWAVMAVGNPRLRRKVYNKIISMQPGIRWASLVHPSTYLGATVELGEGVLVGWNCVLAVSAAVGRFSLVYMCDTVPHDVRLGEFVTLFVDVHLGGACVIGDGVTLGTGSIVLPGVHVGSGSIVGAGAVVTKDIPPNSVAVGVPARVIKEVEEKW